ncbi:MAG TPA: hydrogenase iron-sulfur subunit, partial [Armatimonadota bacterium]|nr:hydrogenase iron-sulfur subunit [Armatimonadota bacterium]
FDDANIATKVCSSVIIAIGQRADLGCLEGSDIEADERGRLTYSITTLGTSKKGVFAAGEVGTGPGAAIEAVREGHRAAIAISHYIDTGEIIELPEPDIAKPEELTAAVAQRVQESGRFDPDMIPAEERVQDFREVETGLTEAEALAESRRCLACLTGAEVNEAACAGCLTCVRICPYDIPTVDRTAAVHADQCQACGLCATECPAGAITLARYSSDDMRDRIAELKEAAGDDLKHPLVLSYCCVFETTSRKYLQPKIEEAVETGILRILVPCAARLSLNDLLAPLELGADGVVVLSCDENDCVTPAAEAKLMRHVRQARTTLEDAGVPADRILHFRTQGSAEESWEGSWAEALETLRTLESAASSEVTK